MTKKASEQRPVPFSEPERPIMFPGQEHPNAATPDVFHQEDASQSSRHLTPETANITIVKKGDTK